MKSRIRSTFCIGLLLGFSASAAAQGFPDFGKLKSLVGKSKDAAPMDEAQEIELGSGIASNLLGAAPLVKNPETQQYVNRIGRWLAMQSERPDLPWHFGVLDSPNVNAFAAPGGYIFVTRGLLQRMRSEDELAGVLAHEIAHVLRKHHLVAIQKAAKTGMMKDVLSMAASQGGRGEGWTKVISAGTELYARGLDKGDEFEADRMGVVLAARAGYDPYGLAAVLHTLDSLGAKDSSLALMFKTHPTPSARMLALDAAMGAGMDAYSNRAPNPRFNAVVR